MHSELRRTTAGTAIPAKFFDAVPYVGEVEGTPPGATATSDRVRMQWQTLINMKYCGK